MSKFIRCIFVIFLILSCCVFSASHTVVKGDTLWGISRRYGLTVAELCKANNIQENQILRIGTNLVLPIIKE